ncbi:MAG: tetratricopeptide (TPR) repeat protein [Paracoccaceae bacterium]|jgi:tetratricopeptide (TPR) repeat protein
MNGAGDVKRLAIQRAILALALTGFAGAEVHAASRSLAGSYLSARHATQRNDLAAASEYWTQALALSPSNDRLREQALNFKVMAGDLTIAATLAEALFRRDPEHRLANLTLVADAFSSASFDAALDRIETSAEGAFPPLLSSLLSGWAQTGRGDRAAAEAAFAVGTGDGNAMYDLFGGYHSGLALMTFGDFDAAAEVFARTAEAIGGGGARLARAHGIALEAAGRPDEAKALWQDAIDNGRADVLLSAELERLEAGKPGALPVRSARSGAAEAMFSIAGALSQERGGPAALLYGQLALSLRPELHEARLLVGELLDAQSQHAMAAASFAAVPRTSPFHVSAEIGRAEALRQMEREPEAIVALQVLSESYPDALQAHIALGDLLRREERFAEAAVAYTRALDLVPNPQERHWALFYERGIALERSGEWDGAEADFLKALELQPEQPLALNYLGYSWVEQNRNLVEALSMIERAVAQRPDDGYITDSLGWVLYRMGEHDKAVPLLERAVELTPVDPVINDHLGDALWMVGRKREAEFQWRRALSFKPDEDEAERIRNKLARGLDAVLAVEVGGGRAGEAAPTPNGG